MRKRVTTKSNL